MSGMLATGCCVEPPIGLTMSDVLALRLASPFVGSGPLIKTSPSMIAAAVVIPALQSVGVLSLGRSPARVHAKNDRQMRFQEAPGEFINCGQRPASGLRGAGRAD